MPTRLLYSARRWDEMIYRDSLARLAVDDPTLEVALTFAREREGIDPDFGAGSTA